MNLDRALRDAEVVADLLVQLTADQMSENLTLARREPLVAIASRVLPRSRGTVLRVSCDRTRHGLEKHWSIHWLREEIDRPRLHRPNPLGYVAVSGQEHDGQRILRHRQSFLEIQAARPGQLDIEHEAAGFCRWM